MSFRFRRSIPLLPGIRLNLGTTGLGISAGIRGLRVGSNSHGQRYASIGVPGTGLSLRQFSRQPHPRQQTVTLTPLGWGMVVLIAVCVLWLFSNVV